LLVVDKDQVIFLVVTVPGDQTGEDDFKSLTAMRSIPTMSKE